MQVWPVKAQDSIQSSKVPPKWNELVLGCEEAWLSSCQSRTHDVEFGEYSHPETSARTGYRLLLIADCPIIGYPDVSSPDFSPI